MNDSYSITANFELDYGWYSLTTSSTEGGEVDTPGEGISVHEANPPVDLVAVNETYYHFVKWTGDISTVGNVTSPATTIAMNASYSITANFALDDGYYSLTTASTEGGSVTEPGEGTSVHAANKTVPLVAEPYEGYPFLKWTGDVSTIADIYAAATNITMYDSYSVTATFKTSHPEPVMATLTVSSTRGGSVIDPGEGLFSYPLGTEVSLVAEPDEGGQFLRWTGDVDTIADVNVATTTITMDNSYSIIANFSGGGWCFIATAAYGTPMAKEIEILRGFRDEYLLTNPVGKALVEFYYRVSPPIAEFITEHPGLKLIVRAGLLPAVAMSAVAINTSLAQKAAIVGLLVLLSVALAVWATKRRGRGPEYT